MVSTCTAERLNVPREWGREWALWGPVFGNGFMTPRAVSRRTLLPRCGRNERGRRSGNLGWVPRAVVSVLRGADASGHDEGNRGNLAQSEYLTQEHQAHEGGDRWLEAHQHPEHLDRDVTQRLQFQRKGDDGREQAHAERGKKQARVGGHSFAGRDAEWERDDGGDSHRQREPAASRDGPPDSRAQQDVGAPEGAAKERERGAERVDRPPDGTQDEDASDREHAPEDVQSAARADEGDPER